jgi:hypothetical protein
MNSGNRWKHGYTGGGVGDDWLSGKDSELVKLGRGKEGKRTLKHGKNGKRHREGKISERAGENECGSYQGTRRKVKRGRTAWALGDQMLVQ